MIFLLLSIVCSTSIYVLFKAFGRYGVGTMEAIVINYYVAAAFGLWYVGQPAATFEAILSAPWLGWAALVGTLFITLFYIMAAVSQSFGVTVASVASKMSLIIPVGILIAIDPEEGLGVTKLLGILSGVLAVFYTSDKGKRESATKGLLILPIVLFIGSGGLDFLLAMVQKTYLVNDIDYKYFVPVPFLFAAVLGSLALLFQKKKAAPTSLKRNALGGLILGLVNYGSIYFLLKAIGSDFLDRSSAIPANNIGIVMLSTVAGLILFKERLSGRNIAGVVLALCAILLLTYLQP